MKTICAPAASASPTADTVIAIKGLTRRFGNKLALGNIAFEVPRGCVLGLVGANGAGKTTLIKHLLGMLKAETGSVRVFGLDPVVDPVGVLGRIGYLSERRELPDWMRIEEFLCYTQAFYPGWDEGYSDRLLNEFQLDPRQLIKTLSQGQLARVGLISALAYRPELLILDEPSSGLDPVARRDILEAIIRAVADAGQTVLFSSHLIDEVERIADRVVMLQDGQIVLNGATEEVRGGHISAVLAFSTPQSAVPALPGAYSIAGYGAEWRILFGGSPGELEVAAARVAARVLEKRTPTLDEILVARAGGKGG